MGRVSDMQIENEQDIADAFERCLNDIHEVALRYNTALMKQKHDRYFVPSLRACFLDGRHDKDLSELLDSHPTRGARE